VTVTHILSSRILLRPRDLEISRTFYRDALGLDIYREFGTGSSRGTVFFLGGGFLEVSGHSETPAADGVQLWLQVADLAAAHREFIAQDVRVLREPRREPWGLLEMWVSDPDGVRICVVEIPADHPLRLRP
jgi:predicted enzyme related to lactoylglutathione lyase